MKINRKNLLAIVGILTIAGILVSSNPELFQGKLTKFKDLKQDFTPQESNNNQNDTALAKLLELSKTNPHLYYLYRDHLDEFETNLKAGIFENLETMMNMERVHYQQPTTDEELIESQLELFEILNLKTINFDNKLPSALQNQTVELIIDNEVRLTMVVKKDKLKIIEKASETTESIIRISITRDAYLSLLKEELSAEEQLESGAIQVAQFDQKNTLVWEIMWDAKTKSYQALTPDSKLIFEISTK